ncbi:ABC transporter permease subunit [Crocosphaera sp. XPORK-15E]|uniref:ABC transporter permease subunit n=1 Tax=Crocosphaera sp. XPORK-15E TaxID=3110247 RepID=UPI002B1EB514|nr:ABC transporter permease subunit [Crocosphaera sp. XPORK-15E]MEA5534611.1 ABC transporter permease subunit [Crocosphaera sp. XPORK-15E]
MGKYKRLFLVYLVLTFVGIFIIITLNFKPNYAQDKSPVLKIATEPTFPPFEMLSIYNSLEGFDIDLMKAIAKETDLTIEFESLPFDGIIPALQSGTIDGAISAITITAERAKTISFSRPYFKSGLAIAVNKDNKNINNFDDLINKKVAVQIGTTGANEVVKIPGVKISTFDNASLALQELLNGNVDAVVNDAPATLYALKIGDLTKLKIVDKLLTEEYYGIALPKNSPNINIINNGLLTIIENGTYQAIYQKWFGGKPPELPVTAPVLKSATSESIKINQILANLWQGTLITLQLTIISACLGIIIGSLIALALMISYRPLRWLARLYIDFLRGTPLLVQIFMIYFGLPALFQDFGVIFNWDRQIAAITALSLNASAYLAEILRGGIQSIDKGQWEASQVLGLNYLQTMRLIIFPQAFRRMLAPLGNEFITLLKDTSLVAVIGFEELFRQGQLMVATTYRAFEIYAMIAIIYLLLTLMSARLFRWLENYMNPVNIRR